MMDAAQQIRAADDLMALWRVLLPEHKEPGQAQLLAWIGMHSPETAAFALNRAARKARRQQSDGTPMDSEHLGRYITGVVRNQRDGRHIFVEVR
jgi:hypothetical protein